MRLVFLITSTLAVCLGAVPKSTPVLPLVFEPNRGQVESEFDYVARTQEGTVLISNSGVVLQPANGRKSVRMTIQGAASASSAPSERQVATTNYFVGVRSQWRAEVPHYGKVRYENIYPGIDVVYYGTGRQLEYDFVVAPGRSFSDVELTFEGARKLRTDAEGNLLIETDGATIRQLRPRVYQTVDGERKQIAGTYRVKPGNRVQFLIGSYDRRRELVIDPVVQFAAYVGRDGHDSGVSVVTDASGNMYVAGSTNSTQLATSGAYQNNRSDEADAYIAKFSPSGILQFLTYFGGSGFDTGLAVGVDSAGNSYVAGVTLSKNLPASTGALSTFGGEEDGFVAKFNENGSRLLWATYVGGSATDWLSDVSIDAEGGAWVTGWTRSTNFPVRGAFQSASAGGGGDVFITRIASSGESFTYSTYFGAEGRDLGSGIAVDAQGMVHITGATSSTALPAGLAPRTPIAGGLDAFIAKLNPRTNEVIYGRVLGGSGEDFGIRIAADSAGNSYAVGYTASATFPSTRGSLQSTFGGNNDIFVAKVNGTTGATEYATFLGGNGDDWSGGIAVDAAGSAYVSGWTNSGNFPMRNPIQSAYSGGEGAANQRFDAIVARLSPGGDSLLYSTYYGGAGEDKAYGLTLDRSGNVVITGTTTTPLIAGATDGLTAGGPGSADAFVTRLSADSAVSLVAAQPTVVNFTARLGETGSQTATVAVTTTGTQISYSAGSNTPWLTVTPENGQIPRNLTISVNTSSLPPGASTGEVIVRTSSNSITIPVTVTVILAPLVTSAAPSTIAPGAGTTAVTLTGNGYTSQSVVEINGTRVPTTLVDQRNLRVTVPAELTRSAGTLSVIVINPDARSVAFPITVAAVSPALSAGTILHGATNAAGPVSPGQIVTISGTGFGPAALLQAGPGADGRLPLTLADTVVRFDDLVAPVLWVESGRIAAIVPAGVAGRTATQLTVESRGQRSPATSVAVVASSPGLFTADASGRGAAAALNQDGSGNTPANPAARGTVVVLYVTGGGPMNPALPDGALSPAAELARPVLPVSVTIGGIPADVQYAGGAPGLVSALMQLNVRVPEGVPAGEAPVIVTTGGQSSPSGVTVSVR